ncbi:MAG: SWIM zinc finger family protein [Synergistaceae bacterium]|jgi:uncharacterized Zn finger protein|nr:SWIM zinc finger family protein [Synergistaceae bacterium]
MSWGYHEYVPVGKKKAFAQKKLDKLRKKDPDISPIVIEGKKIATTFWGAAWNRNLESYADYTNRIKRGSAYVKNGFVVDLRIKEGLVLALVQGSHLYEVKITIDELPAGKWKKILEQCGHSIANMAELAEGKFPKDLAEIFLQQNSGLFPSPKEIHFDCDCPDWAYMCKHVAAVLYGVGARFDREALLFFTLRGIPFEDLLKKSIEGKLANMLKNAGNKSKRVLGDDSIADIFNLR